MKAPLALVVWAASLAALMVLSGTWSPVQYVLIIFGAICGASIVLIITEGVVQKVRNTLRMHRYERRRDRERAAFLAQRDRFSRKEER